MKNCMVAQSGGPTAVINASAAGVVEGNKHFKYFDNVYGGLNGIEGILSRSFVNLSGLSQEKLELMKYTPSSALCSCRYKLKDYKEDDSEYKLLFEIFEELSIDTFFYIGGNDSMDTVYRLSEYAKMRNIGIKFIGIPKTIDNDLWGTDHTPGFGSAAKYIATTVLETYFDSRVYPSRGINIIEVMGRDTGWLSASAALAEVDGEKAADFIYLPEVPFVSDDFLKDIEEILKLKKHINIVVSEGIRNEKGKFISEMDSPSHYDKFGHAQLGGVGGYLKALIKESKLVSKVKSLELGIAQRCAMHTASQTDIEEACRAGFDAVGYSMKGVTGQMVAIVRVNNTPYASKTQLVNISEVANKIKYVPREWINEKGNNVTEAAVDYVLPLIMGTPEIRTEKGLPKFMKII